MNAETVGLERAIRSLATGVWGIAIGLGLALIFMVINLILLWGMVQDSAAIMEMMMPAGMR